MRGVILGALVAVLLGAGLAPWGAQAGRIERACLGSGRDAASRPLCDCIQRVADATLKRRDQRMAARFFDDPHRAQVVRQSDRRSHEAFWQRYKRFGELAEGYCAALRASS